MKTHIPSAPASRCCSRLSKWCASASCAASGPWPCSTASACVDKTTYLLKGGEWSMVNGEWWLRVTPLELWPSRQTTLNDYVPFTIHYLRLSRLHPAVERVLAADGLVGRAGADDLHLLDR